MIESIILEGMLFRNPVIFQKTQRTCALIRARKICNICSPMKIIPSKWIHCYYHRKTLILWIYFWT